MENQRFRFRGFVVLHKDVFLYVKFIKMADNAPRFIF